MALHRCGIWTSHRPSSPPPLLPGGAKIDNLRDRLFQAQLRLEKSRAIARADRKLSPPTSEHAMIDHVGFPVSDFARAKAFYEKALAPLGYALVMEVQQAANDAPAAGFGIGGKPDFWIGGEGGAEQADAYRDRGEGPRRGRCLLQGRARGRRPRTTARPAFARIITRIITAPSCSIPTATISRLSATPPHDPRAGSDAGFDRIMRQQTDNR